MNEVRDGVFSAFFHYEMENFEANRNQIDFNEKSSSDIAYCIYRTYFSTINCILLVREIKGFFPSYSSITHKLHLKNGR